MKAFVWESLICGLALGMTFAGSLNAQSPSPDTARYGPYPTYYKEIIMQWLNKQLIDPDSARIEWSAALRVRRGWFDGDGIRAGENSLGGVRREDASECTSCRPPDASYEHHEQYEYRECNRERDVRVMPDRIRERRDRA